MYDKDIELIMAKYLDNKATGDETCMVLEHLLASERDRQIINLATAGLRSMQLVVRKNKG